MKRQIYNELMAWQNRQDRKPLVILGARQVGKTWIMRHFGIQEYENVAYVNCDDEPRAKDMFVADYDKGHRDRYIGSQRVKGTCPYDSLDSYVLFPDSFTHSVK